MDISLDVPYRCPRCGGNRTFYSLAELKSHIAEEHAFSAQRRQRSHIFDYSPKHSFMGTGRHSPLLQNLLDEGDVLEEALKAAKKEELQNKLARAAAASSKPSTPLTSTATLRIRPASKLQGTSRRLKVNFNTPRSQKGAELADSYLQQHFSVLSHEVLSQRQQQYRTADALYSTQDVLSGVEQAAEERVSEQKNFIAELTRQLAEKEKQLLALRTELETAKERDREKGQGEGYKGLGHNSENFKDQTGSIESKNGRTDGESASRERELIEDDLVQKKQELESINKQLAMARQNNMKNNTMRESAEKPQHKSPSASEKNLRRSSLTKLRRPPAEHMLSDHSSHVSDATDSTLPQRLVSVSRTSSSSTKDRLTDSSSRKNRHNHRLRNKEAAATNLDHFQHQPERHRVHNQLQHENGDRPLHHRHHQHPQQKVFQQRAALLTADRLRGQKLKAEHQELVGQMKELLAQAATDNEKLKDQLAARENQLQTLSQQLQRTRIDQSELMEETFDLYKEAEKSLAGLKGRLRAKEQELERANSRLEETRGIQQKLNAEKEGAAQTSDDRDLLYQNMMRDRDDQINTLNELLLSQQEERTRLQGVAEVLKHEIADRERVQQHLSQAIADKEKELAMARDDVDTLSKFLQTAAAKESVARSKLEAFVSELIDRADQAEAELKRLHVLESGNRGGYLPQSGPGWDTAHQHSASVNRPPDGDSRHKRDMESDHVLGTSQGPWYNNLGNSNLPHTNIRSAAFSQPHGCDIPDGGDGHFIPSVMTQIPNSTGDLSSTLYTQPSSGAGGFSSSVPNGVLTLPTASPIQNVIASMPQHQQQGQHMTISQSRPGQSMNPVSSQHFVDNSYQPRGAQHQGMFQTLPSYTTAQLTDPYDIQNQSEPFVTVSGQHAQSLPTQHQSLQRPFKQFASSNDGVMHSHNTQVQDREQQKNNSQHYHQLEPVQQQQTNQPSSNTNNYNNSRHPSEVNSSTGRKEPAVDVYHIQTVQKLPLSQSSGDTFSLPLGAVNSTPFSSRMIDSGTSPVPEPPKPKFSPANASKLAPRVNQVEQHQQLRATQYSPEFDVDDDSSAYAALPRNGKEVAISSHPANANLHVSAPPRQSPEYDAGDEQDLAFSSSHDGESHVLESEKSHDFLVNAAGKIVKHDKNVKSDKGSISLPSSPVLKHRSTDFSMNRSAKSYSSSKASLPKRRPGRLAVSRNLNSNLGSHGSANKMRSGRNGDGGSFQDLSARDLISPSRTYPIVCVTGEDAKDVEYLSDSALSYQDTPHFHKAVLRRKPRTKGDANDSSTDGLELSVDENGIIWASAESLSEVSESYRMSPCGSETAGDVDSSVLLSSHSPSRRAKKPFSSANDGQSTDDDLDNDLESLDENGILRPSGGWDMEGISGRTTSGSGKKVSPERTVQEPMLPLGERISRVLKTIGRDEDSESLDLLIDLRNTNNTRNNLKHAAAHSAENGGSPTSMSLPHSSAYRRQPQSFSDQPELDSPLKRALAVQDRVKSLTFPRTHRKSVTISDTTSSTSAALVPRPPAVPAMNNSRSVSHLRKVDNSVGYRTNNNVARNGLEDSVLEDFSSSSYSSIPPNAPLYALMKEKPDARSWNSPPQNAVNSQAEMNPGVAGVDGLNAVNDSSLPASSSSISPPQMVQNGKISPVETGTMKKQPRRNSGILARQTSFAIENDVADRSELLNGNKPTTIQQVSAETEGSVQLHPSNSNQKSKTADVEQSKQTVSGVKTANQQAKRDRFSQSHSESSLQSSDGELISTSPPLALPSPQPLERGDSTDLELDSDFEKIASPGGELRKGVVVGKAGMTRKVLHKKHKGKRTGMQKLARTLSSSQDNLDSSCNVSDAETDLRLKRREEKRSRRVALFCVFSYLDTPSLCTVSKVCKEWRRVSRHPALWKCVRLQYECISSKFLVTISKWCTQLVSLTLEGLRAGSRRPQETLDEYQRRTRGCLESGLEELLKASQNSLQSLTIASCSNILTEKCMWLVSGYCRLLQRLTYLSDTHPLTAEVMWALGGGCPSITTLVIPPLFPCHNSEGMTNRCLLLIAQFYPDLLEVGVGGQQLDITGLAPLVQSCQRLHVLRLHRIKELGEDSATALCRTGLRQLQRLQLVGTPVTASSLRAFYNSCRHLKEIEVTVSIGDYFEDVRKKKNKEDYRKIVVALQELKSQAGLGNILQLKATQVE